MVDRPFPSQRAGILEDTVNPFTSDVGKQWFDQSLLTKGWGSKREEFLNQRNQLRAGDLLAESLQSILHLRGSGEIGQFHRVDAIKPLLDHSGHVPERPWGKRTRKWSCFRHSGQELMVLARPSLSWLRPSVPRLPSPCRETIRG
jgi:hypothetical protein